jgi:phospholipid/cholesterol/gamma-HCH transport system substrate-binding protein
MTWAELRVGLLVLAAIAGAIVLILAVSGDITLFADRITLKTEMSGAEGLKAGDEVRLAGVRVGSVKSVDFSPQIPENMQATAAVVITMSIDGPTARERIRSDSKVVLRQLGLLGGQYLDITPGTLGGDRIREGDTIDGLRQTTIDQVVESSGDLLTGFKSLTTRLNAIADQVDRGEGNLGRFLHDEAFYMNLNRTLTEAQELIRRIREGEGTAGKMINDPKLYEDLRDAVGTIQSLVDGIQRGEGTAGKFIKDDEIYRNLNEAMEKLKGVSDRVDRLTAQIDKGEGTIGKLVYDEKLHQDLSAAMASIKSISERLDRGEGTAGRLLHDEQLYNNLNALSAESVKLLYDFRQNPKKYLSIKVTLF